MERESPADRINTLMGFTPTRVKSREETSFTRLVKTMLEQNNVSTSFVDTFFSILDENNITSLEGLTENMPLIKQQFADRVAMMVNFVEAMHPIEPK